MLKCQDVAIAHGANTLFSGLTLNLYPKHVVGVVGANGCGKSSLFAAVFDGSETAHGSIQIKSGTRINRLQQEVPALEQSALAFTLAGDAKLAAIYDRLAQAEAINDYAVVMECHTQLSECDGYRAEARAAKILHGLGFSQDAMQQPVKSFSGGWRMRLSLAQCLMTPSELLLLDEPTNHLDMEAILWLENFIKHYSGAILMVSHDRDFLDNTVSHILHIDNQTVKHYTGSYTQFEAERAQAILLQQAQYRKQQVHIKHMQSFVDRFRYKATKAKQAQSRLKALNKLELIQPIYEQSPFQFQFRDPDRMPSPMIKMEKVGLGYGEEPVLDDIRFTLAAGMRLGLLGVNGAGKSTFIKGLVGELPAQHGVIETMPGVKIGYFAQHQVDDLCLSDSPLVMIRRMAQGADERTLTAFLGGFGFSRDQALEPMQKYSGGEKSRVALAMMVWQKPNLLLLDEPTNHLDMEMRSALMFALQNYPGALVLVSHDRYLLRSLVDELYLVQNGTLTRFEGAVEDYYNQAKKA